MTLPILILVGLQAAAPRAAQAPKPPATTVVGAPAPVIVAEDTPRGRRTPAGPNVRIDVTLSDLGGAGSAATTKAVTVTTSDGTWGKLRAQVTSRAYGGAPLNVDVRPWLQANGQVLVELTIEYSQGRNPDAEGNPDRILAVSINQSASLLLDSGKPLTLSQSADPIGERRVTVEVKATVLK